jgi:hypothetical protein
MAMFYAKAGQDRRVTARELRAFSHRLRNSVDDIDLHLMGVTNE